MKTSTQYKVMLTVFVIIFMNISAFSSISPKRKQTSWNPNSLSKSRQQNQVNGSVEFHELNYRWDAVSDDFIDAPVTAMAIHNGKLHIGGLFKHIGNRNCDNIAVWDGQTWDDLGDGLGSSDYEVLDMVSYGGELYVVYYDWWSFDEFFKKWNGTSWIDLSGSTNGDVYTIVQLNGQLLIGGDFSQASGVVVNNIAIGDGTTWSALGVGVGGAVHEITAVSEPGVGNFYAVYHEFPDPVSGFPEPTHISLYHSVHGWIHDFVEDLDAFAWVVEGYWDRLYVGGELYEIGGTPVMGLAQFSSGGGWRQVASKGSWGGDIYSVYHSDRSLYAGGWMGFSYYDSICFGIGKKNGDTWLPLGQGVWYNNWWGEVWSNFVTIGEYLYVGGYFDTAGGKKASNLARYRMTVNYAHFTPRTTVAGGIHGSTSLGCAWGDSDGDGDEDLFVANDWGKQNYLFRNNGDGTFKKHKNSAIVQDSKSSAAGSWGDIDNDGDLDLFVVNRNGENNQLFLNNGDGTFAQIMDSPIVSDAAAGNATAWADYDNDGFIDLFVANKSGQNNLLYHNNGDGTFIQITDGPVVTDGGNSRGCAWGDYNNDGNVDLFVANNQHENNFLYQNNGDGTFAKVIDMAVVTDGGGSWSGSWGDYDSDGDLDLFVANDGQPNFFYQNNLGVLERIIKGELTAGDTYSRSAVWGDCDKDGDLDLFVGIRGNDSHLYINRGEGTFVLYMVPGDQDSRGAAWCDFDNDGDLDLFQVKNGYTNSLLTHNDNDNHYVKIKCIGTTSNKSGIGAKVFVTAVIDDHNITQMQEINSQAGTGGQNSLIATFGLKDATSIEKVRIEWPSGIIWESDQVDMDQLVTIEEPAQDVVLPIDQDADIEVFEEQEKDVLEITDVDQVAGLPKTYQLYQNHPNPFNPETSLGYDLPKSGHVQIVIYDLNGKLVSTLIDNNQSAGHYEIQWHGTNDTGQQMPSGVYVSRFVAGGVVQTKKMVLMR